MGRKNWKKLLLVFFVIGALTFSFWYGGNAPGLQGFSVESDVSNNQKVNLTESSEQIEENDSHVEISQSEKDEVKDGKENIFERIYMQIRKTRMSGNKKKSVQINKRAQKNAQKNADRSKKKKENKSNIDTGSNSKEKYIDENTKTTDKNEQESTDSSDTQTTEKTEESDNTPNNNEKNDIDTSVRDREQGYITCTISISCTSVLNHLDKLTESTRKVIPEDGVILDAVSVDIKEGSTVFDVLKKATKENNVQLEYNYTPAYKTYYIEGIGNLYEFDAGNLSGWMYSVNGTFPGVGCSGYKVKDGDIIQWHYTCNFGKDV